MHTVKQAALLYAPLLIVILIGIFLIFKGNSYPQFTDANAVKALFNSDGPPSSLPDDAREKWEENFSKSVEKYRTPHEDLIDTGRGVCALGLSLIVFLLIAKVRNVSDLINLKSATGTFFLLALNCSVVLIAVSDLQNTFAKDDGYHYPPWADSMGIPLFLTIAGAIVMLLIFNIAAILVLWLSDSPTKCFLSCRHTIFADFVITTIFGFLALLNALYLLSCITSGMYLAVPAVLMYFYLLLCARADLLERWRLKPPATAKAST